MATHPDFPADPPAPYIRPTLLVGVAQPPAHPALIDAEALQADMDAEAIREATGLSPAAFRRFERVHTRVVVAAAGLLLLYMAVRIVAAAFAGRL